MYAPSLTPRTDFGPVPRVEIVFPDVHPDTETATVYRIAGETTYRVRGGVDVFAAGGFALVDTEAPFLVESTYRAELFDDAGLSLGFTDPASTTLDVDLTVFHSPLDPNRWVVVEPRPSFAADLVAPFFGETVQPLDRGSAVRVSFGRTGLRDVALDSVVDTFTDAGRFRSVLTGVPVICVRTHPKWQLPTPLFAAPVEVRERRFDVEFGGESIDFIVRADQVSPPAEALTAGVLTYADMEFAFATYSEAEAAYLTYLDAESDFAKAGLA